MAGGNLIASFVAFDASESLQVTKVQLVLSAWGEESGLVVRSAGIRLGCEPRMNLNRRARPSSRTPTPTRISHTSTWVFKTEAVDLEDDVLFAKLPTSPCGRDFILCTSTTASFPKTGANVVGTYKSRRDNRNLLFHKVAMRELQHNLLTKCRSYFEVNPSRSNFREEANCSRSNFEDRIGSADCPMATVAWEKNRMMRQS